MNAIGEYEIHPDYLNRKPDEQFAIVRYDILLKTKLLNMQNNLNRF